MSSSLKQTLLLTLAAAAFVIGVHRTFVEGLYANYWLFMLSLGLLGWYRYDHKKQKEQKAEPRQTIGNPPPKPAQKQPRPKNKKQK